MKISWPHWFATGLAQQPDIASVRVQDAALGYKRQEPVQLQLNVEFERGALHAVIGENGSGKTCLLKTLAGITEPLRGSVSLSHDQADKTALVESGGSLIPFEHRALWQGYVEQKARVHWNLSVEQVVRLGASARRDVSEADQKRAAFETMASCGCDEFAQRPVMELSAGEQQRVMLARVIAARPKVLLVDEPTAGLDPRYQNTIMQLLHQQAASGTVVITVMHDIDLVRRYCDTVLVLEKRRKIAPGAGLHSRGECKEIAPGAILHSRATQENCTGSDPARFGAVDEVLTPGLLKRVFGIG